MIRFACPRCKSVLEAPDRKVGGKVACPKCQQLLVRAVVQLVWFKCPRCKTSFKKRCLYTLGGSRLRTFGEEYCPRCEIVLVHTLESSEDSEAGGNLDLEIMGGIDPAQHEPWEEMVGKDEKKAIQSFLVNGRWMTFAEFEQEVKEVIQGFRVTAPLLDELIESLPSLGFEIQQLYDVARVRSHIAARLTWKQWYLFKIAGIFF